MPVQGRSLGQSILVALSVTGYLAVFVLLHSRIGDPIVAFTLVPVVAAAWAYGFSGGIVAAVLGVAANIALMQTLGGHDGFRPNQIPRVLAAIGIGAGTGWLRDLSLRQRRLLEDNRRIEENLRAGKLDLERAVEARTALLVEANRALEVEVAARIAAEANLRGMIEGSQDPIWVVRDEKIVFANPAVAALLGAGDAAELVGRDALEILVHPDERAEVAARMDAIATATPSKGPVEVHVRGHDDQIKILEAAMFLVQIDNHPAIVMIGRDATARKALEARAAAADRMAVLGTLTAGIGHEINNPLAIIVGNLGFIAEEMQGKDPDLSQAVRDAQSAALSAGEIVRHMRVFVESSASSANVQMVVDSTVRMVANEIKHRARLEVDVEATPPAALAEAHLGQLLLNLLVNAIHALPDRPVDENRILISVRRTADGARIRLEVSDTGSGVPLELRHRIFDPFFTTKPIGLGTGLGLWVCQQIVTSAGGDITVDSSLGGGSTFRVELPVIAPVIDVSKPAGAVLPARRARVLVLDDDPIVGKSVARLLTALHEVAIMDDAARVLAEIAAGKRFDVILCDLTMPSMGGVEFFTRLQVVAPAQAERVIFMTGGVLTAEASSFFAEDSRRKLEKPFAAEAVRSAIERLLACA